MCWRTEKRCRIVVRAVSASYLVLLDLLDFLSPSRVSLYPFCVLLLFPFTTLLGGAAELHLTVLVCTIA